jgi:hypothetical protein
MSCVLRSGNTAFLGCLPDMGKSGHWNKPIPVP